MQRGTVDVTLSASDLGEAAPDGLLVVDVEGRIRLVNRALESMFGWDRIDLLGEPVEMLLPADARARHVELRDRFAEGPQQRPMGLGLTLLGLRRDGATFPVEISLSPVRTAGGVGTIAAVRDVSERMRVDQELQVAHADLARSEDRERIARDLHDTVIQHLFAVGMQLQAAMRDVPETPADAADVGANTGLGRRLAWAVDHLDQTIREVRSVIFGLSTASDAGLRARINKAAEDASATLGFMPRVIFDGLVDTTVSATFGEHLVAIVRESLSNVARHANATRADVALVVRDDEVMLVVADDGGGIVAGAAEGSGLPNLRARGVLMGGTVQWEAREGGGTNVVVHAPLAGPSTDASSPSSGPSTDAASPS